MGSLGSESKPKLRRWSNQYIALANTLPEYLLNLAQSEVSITERELLVKKLAGFKNIVLEIGSGSGGHLIGQAELDPTSLYVGIELRFKRAFRTAEKAKSLGLKNIFLVRADFLSIHEIFEQGALSGVYVNFPDPWAKKRWLKHRLLNQPFFNWLAKVLMPGGFFIYKSDHLSYFEHTCAEVSNQLELEINLIERDLYRNLREDLNQFVRVKSEFEQLFISKAQPIGLLHVIRRA